jgi:P27 family predicted phage terminase small subunit
VSRKKPTSLRILEGNPGHRPIDKNTPKPAPIRPTCPSWLLPEAKREWRRLAPELERLGLLTTLDRATFACYCESWAWVRRCEAIIAQEGQVVAGHRGIMKKHPLLSALNAATDSMLTVAREFGLTPQARTRIQVSATPEDDGWGDLLD